MAIRDQSYDRYDGPLRKGYAWAVIGWAGFRTYWGFWRAKLTIFAVWLVPVIFGLLVIGEAALPDTGAGEGWVNAFVRIQFFSLALVFVARGCGIISDDLRHRTLQLHFSKPITKLDYAAGKLCTLVLLGMVSVLIPSVLVAGLRTAMFIQSDILADVVVLHMQAMALLGLVVILLSSIVIGLSSLTRRSGYVVLALIALLVVPLVADIIAFAIDDVSPWVRMFSLNGIVGLAGQGLMSGADAMPDGIPIIAPFAAILTFIAAGLGALRWRLTNLDRLT